MAFRWRADDGPLIVVLILSSTVIIKQQQKNLSKLDPPLTKLSGSAHGVALFVSLFFVESLDTNDLIHLP